MERNEHDDQVLKEIANSESKNNIVALVGIILIMAVLAITAFILASSGRVGGIGTIVQ